MQIVSEESGGTTAANANLVAYGYTRLSEHWWFNSTSGTIATWPGDFYNYQTISGIKQDFYYSNVYLAYSTQQPPTSLGVPDTISPTQAGQLGNKIANDTHNDEALIEVVDDFLSRHPQYFNDLPDSIKQSDVQDWSADNLKKLNDDLVDKLQEIVDQNPDDIDAQIALEKAKNDAQKEEETPKEETFNDISISAFDPPYDPGPFDIPARFTSFLGNVKSSGLFSFSSNFFNSLPDGGSPIYEVDGGETFGHHTIDLSDTLTGGLAVAKTVLLALFGFLSIRAVIMKR
ncbi:MAG: hypothetical protein AB7U29_19980 [Desulfobulbus sp.]